MDFCDMDYCRFEKHLEYRRSVAAFGQVRRVPALHRIHSPAIPAETHQNWAAFTIPPQTGKRKATSYNGAPTFNENILDPQY
jgi:hypothetical protein